MPAGRFLACLGQIGGCGVERRETSRCRQPHAAFAVPPFGEAMLWWYQWFMTTDSGAEAVRRDPVGFARNQWETWSPPGWFGETDFAETAHSFTNPDWSAVTLSAYRSRWRP